MDVFGDWDLIPDSLVANVIFEAAYIDFRLHSCIYFLKIEMIDYENEDCFISLNLYGDKAEKKKAEKKKAEIPPRGAF